MLRSEDLAVGLEGLDSTQPSVILTTTSLPESPVLQPAGSQQQHAPLQQHDPTPQLARQHHNRLQRSKRQKQVLHHGQPALGTDGFADVPVIEEHQVRPDDLTSPIACVLDRRVGGTRVVISNCQCLCQCKDGSQLVVPQNTLVQLYGKEQVVRWLATIGCGFYPQAKLNAVVPVPSSVQQPATGVDWHAWLDDLLAATVARWLHPNTGVG